MSLSFVFFTSFICFMNDFSSNTPQVIRVYGWASMLILEILSLKFGTFGNFAYICSDIAIKDENGQGLYRSDICSCRRVA